MLQMFVHFLGGTVADAAVAGQNPFERAGEQLFHGAGLLRPGIPTNVAKGGQGFAFWRPRKMVASEEHFVAIEKNLVAARVTGRGDELKIGIDPQGSRSGDDALDASRCGAPFSRQASQ